MFVTIEVFLLLQFIATDLQTVVDISQKVFAYGVKLLITKLMHDAVIVISKSVSPMLIGIFLRKMN